MYGETFLRLPHCTTQAAVKAKKNPKIQTPQKIAGIIIKFEQCRFTIH